MQTLTKLQRFSFSAKVYNNFQNREFLSSSANQHYEVHNPVRQQHIARVPQSSQEELNAALASAKEAFRSWSRVPLLTRQRYMFDLAAMIRRDHKKLAASITEEHGKITPDAMGDVQRGLQVVEHACGISHIIQGQTFQNISKGIDAYSFRVPLGVCTGVAPFNF